MKFSEMNAKNGVGTYRQNLLAYLNIHKSLNKTMVSTEYEDLGNAIPGHLLKAKMRIGLFLDIPYALQVA